ncbi:MAG: hypothetical protein WD069_07495 [Planctomycetales bacterium]
MTCIALTPLLAAGSNAALYTFLVYTLCVFALAAASNRLLKKKSFLSEYFLGSRSLGVWAFALTFAATSASGGSFTGFPAKIYTHGWILALWIASYMVVPICTMGFLGKRINQVARISGAITVPDVVRDRFQSAGFGLLAVGMIVFFVTFNLVAQFKAGSVLLEALLKDVEVFQNATDVVAQSKPNIEFLEGVSASYLLCLFAFGIAVVFYTTYGGFHAVVWTDVMQGVVMVVGVMIMLPLALYETGGLEAATREMAQMSPPRRVAARLTLDAPRTEKTTLRKNAWIAVPHDWTTPPLDAGDSEVDDSERPELYRTIKEVVIPAGRLSADTELLKIVTPRDIDQVRRTKLFEKDFATLPFAVDELKTLPYEHGANPEDRGVFLTGPGPDPENAGGFLPLMAAVSFFFMWAISGTGQPHNMVRLMAFNSSRTLRRSIFTVAIYYTLIYFPLVIIFCCARVLMPGMEGDPDRIMPAMAVFLTENIGLGWLAGLLVAAPFAAVMSTVDSVLLMISSAVVRDIYQRNVDPEVSQRTIKWMSYAVTLLVGIGAMLGAVNPPRFLQDIIVYVGSGLAACFLAPMVYGLYWRRTNTPGAVTAMLGGFVAHLTMHVAGMFRYEDGSLTFLEAKKFFDPYYLFELHPILIGLFVSFVAGYIVTKLTPPPPEHLVRRYFHAA